MKEKFDQIKQLITISRKAALTFLIFGAWLYYQ